MFQLDRHVLSVQCVRGAACYLQEICIKRMEKCFMRRHFDEWVGFSFLGFCLFLQYLRDSLCTINGIFNIYNLRSFDMWNYHQCQMNISVTSKSFLIPLCNSCLLPFSSPGKPDLGRIDILTSIISSCENVLSVHSLDL